MSNFPTFSPRQPRPEPQRVGDELIRGFWTFLDGISANRLRLPGSAVDSILIIGDDGLVRATKTLDGVFTFTAEDINFSGDVNFTDNIVVGAAPEPYVQLSATGIVLANDSASPLTIQWFDPADLFGNTLTSPALTSTSLAWVLATLGGMVPVVGNDAPAVAAGALGKVDLTAQTADIATTALSNTPPAGFYEVEVIIMTTTADVTAGTQAVVIGWTDNVGATTSTVIAAHSLAATGRTTGRALARVASGNLTYAVTNTGGYGSAAFAVFLRVIALG